MRTYALAHNTYVMIWAQTFIDIQSLNYRYKHRHQLILKCHRTNLLFPLKSIIYFCFFISRCLKWFWVKIYVCRLISMTEWICIFILCEHFLALFMQNLIKNLNFIQKKQINRLLRSNKGEFNRLITCSLVFLTISGIFFFIFFVPSSLG